MVLETIRLALRAISRNVLRSSLTTLGIVVGVAAVIVMVTLGRGATIQVAEDIGRLGTNLLDVRPGQHFHGPGGTRSEAAPFKLGDAEALAREIPDLAAVAPNSSMSTQAIRGNQNWSTAAVGSTNAYLQVRNWTLEAGREFTDSDLRAGKAVCLLGSTVRQELFGSQDSLGATIRLGRISFQVIGLLKSKGQSGFGMDQDDFVLIPLRTFQRRLAGNTEVGAILVSAREGVSSNKVEQDMERLMRQRRRIAPGEADDFHVRDMEELVSTLTGTTRVLTALLSAVAAVSLLVGGIGIMNIMLVSVTERTREIGTRMAIGAREREVLMQFLIEAVVLALFGGLCGILLGFAAARVGARMLVVPFVLDPAVVALAFLFSGVVGVVFGYFPARKAARLDPIEALRHE